MALAKLQPKFEVSITMNYFVSVNRLNSYDLGVGSLACPEDAMQTVQAYLSAAFKTSAQSSVTPENTSTTDLFGPQFRSHLTRLRRSSTSSFS